MIKILRKHRNWLMIVIAILALPFCIYFVKTDYSAIRPDQFARIYDRSVSLVEARRDARLFELAGALGIPTLRQDLSYGANSQAEAYGQFIVNLIILRHEATRLGIRPTESEIVDLVRSLPAFHGESGFDPKKYEEFAANNLGPYGFTEEQIEELARDELCVSRVKQLLSSGVSVPESESTSNYEQAYGKNFVSVIRLQAADFSKDVKINDEDIQKYDEAHKDELKTEEKRKIDFVRLSFSDEQKKLSGKERIDALQKLADRANDFTQVLLEKDADFHKVAAKFQLPVETTGEFTTAAPDPKLKSDPQLGQAAFRLSMKEPNSDPIQTGDGFCILHLTGVTEARPLTLEEAKPKIVDALKSTREREMVFTKGSKVVNDLREGLQTGQPLSSALQAANVKAEKVEPFVIADDLDIKKLAGRPKNELADMSMIRNAASQMQPGDVSDFVPSENGGLIIVLEKRDPPEQAKYQQGKAEFEQKYLKTKQQIVFYEWLHDRQRAADVQFAKG
jgi:SurA N-terminal domain/PPIC-type PPIASE domain